MRDNIPAKDTVALLAVTTEQGVLDQGCPCVVKEMDVITSKRLEFTAGGGGKASIPGKSRTLIQR